MPAQPQSLEPFIVSGLRIGLRRPGKKDAAEFIALNRASRMFHRGLVSPPKTPEQFADFLQRSRREDSVSLVICLVEDGAIIGAIT